MASKISDRIDVLEARLKALKTQQQRMEARSRATKARRDRRDELRKKILVGAVVLAKVGRGELEERAFLGWMERALTREEDRALFSLATPAHP
jgi:hypothetical protein